jgi:DNA-binding IclR family transcriptional regulator
MSNGRSAAEDSPPAVQSVDRALTILEILARRGDAGVTEIGQELGVHKSTAFRLLAVLEGKGFVEQSVERGTYRLGFGIVRLAGATTARLDLCRVGQQLSEELAAEVGETVNVAILDDSGAVNISQAQGGASIALLNWVGRRTPLHATSSGKVLLAFAPGGVREILGDKPLERYTSSTIVDPGLLEEHLEQVRAKGWACTEEELEIGLNAVAAPVRGPDGTVVAAMSVSGPAYRLTPDSVPAAAERVVAAADAFSKRIGYFG